MNSLLRPWMLALPTVVAVAGCQPRATHDRAASCEITRSTPTRDGGRKETYTRTSWDPATRTLRSQTSASKDFAHPNTVLYRFGANGRLLAKASIDEGQKNFQYDYEYDAQKNLIESRLSYPPQPDVAQPSSEPVWMGTHRSNEYDPDGRLVGARVEPYGPGNAASTPTREMYREDERGRCQKIERRNAADGALLSAETRSYTQDDVPSVFELHMTNVQMCGDLDDVQTFDEEGRLKSIEGWSCKDKQSDPPEYTLSYAYATDGASTVELIDFLNDVPNDTLIVDGTEVPATTFRETRTAGCAEVEALLHTQELGCSVVGQ